MNWMDTPRSICATSSATSILQRLYLGQPLAAFDQGEAAPSRPV